MDEQQISQTPLINDLSHKKIFLWIGILLSLTIIIVISYFIIKNKNASTTASNNTANLTSSKSSNVDSFAYLNEGEIWIQNGKISKQFTHTNNEVYEFVVNWTNKEIFFVQGTSRTEENNLYECNFTQDSCNPKFLTKDILNKISIIGFSPDENRLLYVASSNKDENDDLKSINIRVYDLDSSKLTSVLTNDFETSSTAGYQANAIIGYSTNGWLDNNTLLIDCLGWNGKHQTYSLALNQIPTDNLKTYSTQYSMVGVEENSTIQDFFFRPISLYTSNILYTVMIYSSLTNHTQVNYIASIPDVSLSTTINDSTKTGVDTTSLNKFYNDISHYPNFQFENQDYTNIIEKINNQIAFFVVNNAPIIASCTNNNCQLKTLTDNKFTDLSKVVSPRNVTSQTESTSNNIELFEYNFSNNYKLYSLCYIANESSSQIINNCNYTLLNTINNKQYKDLNYSASNPGIGTL